MSNDIIARVTERALKRKDDQIHLLEEERDTLKKKLCQESATLETFRAENAELIDVQKGLEDRMEKMCTMMNETQPLLLKLQNQKEAMEAEKWALTKIIQTRDAQIAASANEKQELAWFHSQRLGAIREQISKEYNEVYLKLTSMLERDKACPELISTLDSLRLLPWKHII